MKPLKGNRNQCPTCNEYFNSTTAFQKHRVGEFEKNRRCRTPEEMLEIGMEKKPDGFWVGSKDNRFKGVENE